MKAPAIEILFPPEGLALIEELKAMPFQMRRAIARGMDKAAALTVSDIQQKRLTGEGPFPAIEGRLGVVTNRLRGSSRFTPARIEGAAVHQTIGTNVGYAHVHEFGFNGQVSVPAHRRKVKSRDQFVKEERVSQKTGRKYRARIKVASGVTYVRAHTRWMQFEARAPFGHGLADNERIYVREILGELRALRQGGPQT
jgi:phage gpG-like protein